MIDKALVSSKIEAINGEEKLKTPNRVFIIPKNTTTPRINVRVLDALYIEDVRQSIKAVVLKVFLVSQVTRSFFLKIKYIIMSVMYMYNKIIIEDFILLDIAIMNRGLGE